jgi:predicted RNA methylase
VEETAARAAAFPIWHFDFDLDGYRTEPSKAEWQNLRAAHFMRPLVEHYGGTLEGKRVLDLGCNAGFFSLTAIEAGCDFVLGIDGRQTHIDQANLVFEVKGSIRAGTGSSAETSSTLTIGLWNRLTSCCASACCTTSTSRRRC